jgi:hypothetical protein
LPSSQTTQDGQPPGSRFPTRRHGGTSLTKVYPPALDKLKELRSDSEKAVRAGTDPNVSFEDFADFNRVLGEETLTTKLFVSLAANNAQGAKQAFRFAERQLANDQQYKLAAKYLHPETDFENFAARYRVAIKVSKSETLKGYAEEDFSHQTTTLVALLVKADRPAEAEGIAAKARKEWDSPDFHAQLEKALEGVFPAAWPLEGSLPAH